MGRTGTSERQKIIDKKRKAKLKPLQVEFRHPDTKEWIKTEILYDPIDEGFDTALIWDAINEVEGMEE
jgi:hypothetical protein